MREESWTSIMAKSLSTLLTRPEDVLVEQAKLVPFARVFGEHWEDAVRLGKVCSAKRAAGSLSLSAVDLADKCRQARERGLVVMLNQVTFFLRYWSCVAIVHEGKVHVPGG